MTVSTDHAYSAGWGQDAQDEPGGRMVATDGRALPLQGARLHADACAGQCRVVLQQWFHNPHPEPLEVRYRLPLPADGAVSGFAFTIDGRRIVGQIDRKQVARARYERALAEGRSAALLEQERSSLFTQKVGNIPPGATVVAEVTIDQPLQWIDSPSFGGWEWRFPTVVGPRFMGARGRVPDASRVSVPVADGPLRAGVELELRVRDSVVAGAGALPSSPSHQLDVRREGT
ncbi:MAG: hypothetical protein KC468_07130, partial [Myxococcales bacterium]|nr:hypothetical protein [Myxococcales bacterium]